METGFGISTFRKHSQAEFNWYSHLIISSWVDLIKI